MSTVVIGSEAIAQGLLTRHELACWYRLIYPGVYVPNPVTQIPAQHDWKLIAVLDMGWEEFGVAAEYDGDQHRSDRRQYGKDRWRLRRLTELGWSVVTVIAEDRPKDIVERVRQAMTSRGWRP